jgi:hypothetical protein
MVDPQRGLGPGQRGGTAFSFHISLRRISVPGSPGLSQALRERLSPYTTGDKWRITRIGETRKDGASLVQSENMVRDDRGVGAGGRGQDHDHPQQHGPHGHPVGLEARALVTGHLVVALSG